MNVEEFARRVPKAELHVHVDGCLEPELKLAIAARNGIPLAERTVEEVRATYVFHDLTSFLAMHYPNVDVLRTEQDFYDLCWSYLRRAAAQGVRHAEIFFDPQLQTGRGIPFAVMIGGYRRAIEAARTELGVRADLIMCFLRDRGAEYAMSTLMQALPHREWIVGVGLDSEERGHPPREFAEVYARARSEGLMLTAHCDIQQEGSCANIREAIDVLGVSRIDHGVEIVGEPELLRYARDRGVAFTVCPLSNGSVVPDMRAPAILTMFEAGLDLSVSCDDPPYFGGYAGDNYAALATALDLSHTQVAEFARRSFRASWLGSAARERHLAEIDAFAAANTPAPV